MNDFAKVYIISYKKNGKWNDVSNISINRFHEQGFRTELIEGYNLKDYPEIKRNHIVYLNLLDKVLKVIKKRNIKEGFFIAEDDAFPADYVTRMLELMQLKGQRLACASYQGRTQPVFGLWPVDLFDDLYKALVEDDIRKVDRFTAPYGVADVAFDELTHNPFFNVNKPEDIAIGEQQLAQQR